ncbi:MAG: tetratricopeptide repeat protein [Succinivibrio sp.]|jgi:putative thioredoxin|nr:tetratricopeptide repeat protein [Succinivibrio sp.]
MQLTEQNAQQILVDGSKNKAVFVYFYANAPQCESTNKLVKGAIPDTNEYITLAEADVTTDVGQAIAMQLGLQAVPALVVLKNSRPVDALQGADIEPNLSKLIAKYMPSQAELLIKQARELEAKSDLSGACAKAGEAYKEDEKNLEVKFYYAGLCIKAKNLARAHELLDNPGRTEAESQDYKDLISALTLAEQAADSPELHKLKAEHEQDPEDSAKAAKYAAALSESGKHKEALELLFGYLKKDLGNAEIKKTFIDILNTLNGDPLQKTYRGRLYALMY